MRRYVGYAAAMLFVTSAWLASILWLGKQSHEDKLSVHLYLKDSEGKSRCTGTPIGPNVILTASHCEYYLDADAVKPEIRELYKIDDMTDFKVDHIERDGADHSEIFLDRVMFKKWAKISYRLLEPEEKLHFWGYPKGFNGAQVYREGKYVANALDETNMLVLVLDCWDEPGDSGSAVFDKEGNIVGIVSYTIDYVATGVRPFTGYWARSDN